MKLNLAIVVDSLVVYGGAEQSPGGIPRGVPRCSSLRTGVPPFRIYRITNFTEGNLYFVCRPPAIRAHELPQLHFLTAIRHRTI